MSREDMTKEEYREYFLANYRHSMAHILAKAVIEIFGKENVQYAIGPQIDDGMYYDFVLPRTVTKEDYKTIEDKMREIIKRREAWKREEISRAAALEMFKDQKFKYEIIKDLPEDELLTIYYTGEDYVDLCRGPHVFNSEELMNVAFQVKSVSGAYWRGNEKLDQLQRIYVYVYPDKNALKEHLAFIKEAMERDHKKLGLSRSSSCSMRLHRVCHTGFQGASSSTMLCSSSGEEFMRSTVIRRFLHLLSITEDSGRHQDTGVITRKICSL